MINNIHHKEIVKFLTNKLCIGFIVKKFRFCVGDRFYLCNNKILCENDYAEYQMHTEMSQQHVNSGGSSNSSSNNTNTHNNNNNEYSMNRNTPTKNQASSSNSNSMMPLYSEKNNFTNFDVPIHVR